MCLLTFFAYAFAMLTLNADDHAIFKRMHRPTNLDGSPKEQRGVVMLARDRWGAWLSCKDPQVARTFLSLYPTELIEAQPAPPERKSERPRSAPPASGDLF